MADLFVGGRLRQGLLNEKLALASELETDATYVGVLNGVDNIQTALQRLDGSGIGAAIFRFTGSYSAQNSNINEWFGGRQLTRMRCIDSGTGSGVSGAVPFTLAGATALNAAFDQLVAAGLPEQITFVIEYTGASDDFLQISARSGVGNPVITNTTNIIVRSGVAATLEVTRTAGVLSDYTFVSIGGVGNGGNLSADAIKLQNPTTITWDAGDTGTLPSSGVAKGNAYQVINAPADGSGRFDEPMADGDWVVWAGDTFTSWQQTPHNWFVIAAHDVRRISALEDEFLTHVQRSAVSDRNGVVRGNDYALSAGELRLKIYPTVGNYSAADLNTTGDIDAYTNTSDISGILAIRLDRNNDQLITPLEDLYVYNENADGDFILIGNMARDFTFQGNFGGESDWTSNVGVSYTTGDTIRIYIGTTVPRYNNPSLDVDEDNLTPDVQAKLNRTGSNPDELARLNSLENKVATLYPLAPDVDKLEDLSSIFDASRTVQEVVTTRGYTSMVDYRGDTTRYEQAGITYDNTGTDVVRYTGMQDGFFRLYGFKVTAPADKTLLSLGTGTDAIPLIDVTAAGNYRVNNYHVETTAGDTVTNQFHRLTRTAGDAILTSGETNVATYTITNYPTGATNGTRSLQVSADVLVNGVDTEAAHIFDLPVPALNAAQARQTIDETIFLGPLHGNRSVTVTFSYQYRVSGNDLLVDLRLVTAPSDVTIEPQDVAAILNYTAADTQTRVDNWSIITDAGGNYTFTGENELLILGAPIVGGDANTMEWVPVARETNGTVVQLNDAYTAVPHVGFTSIEVPDDEDFRAAVSDHFLRHSELATLVARADTQWVYGLARLSNITEHQFTELVDFTQNIALTSPDGTRWELSVSDTGELLIDSK